MTAEFATVIPAVLLVLAACLAGLQVATQQVRLQQVAAMAARSVARGEAVGTSTLVPGSTLRVEHRGDLACVTASARGSTVGSWIGAVTVSASSCALDGGR
ncbi:TadE family type IV pilus minor pilin [Lacisediminihabitans sp. FW035]